MSLSLISNGTSLAPNGMIPFAGTGGIPPYVYSVVPGGVGGSINATSGVYVAPAETGFDTIRVVDSILATATTVIGIQNVLEMVCNIIQTGLGLPNGRIWLWNQKVNIPIDEKLYITVGVEASKVFGNDITYLGSTAVVSCNVCDTLSIDAMSRGPIARDQLNRIVLSFNSAYAEQQMELNSFRIFPVSTPFLNISGIDGAAIPYRFRNTVKVQYFVTSVDSVQYFSTFDMPIVVPDSAVPLNITTESGIDITTEDGQNIVTEVR